MAPDWAAQECIQSGFENLQGWGCHNLPRQPVPVTDCPPDKTLSPYMQSDARAWLARAETRYRVIHEQPKDTLQQGLVRMPGELTYQAPGFHELPLYPLTAKDFCKWCS